MKDTHHNYKMGDIRKCFSTVGDTTLSKWLDKGLISHQSNRKGIRANIRYSALDIVHVGILTQLSTWGVLNYYKDAKVSGGYVSLETLLFFSDEELAALPASSGYHPVCALSLTEPDKMVDYYCSRGPELKMIVTFRQVPVEQADKRMRTTKTEFNLLILSPSEYREWEQERFGLRSEISKLFTIDAPIQVGDVPVDFYAEFGLLTLDIDMLIGHVYKKLDILSLLG
jgi:hypothetical protein